MRRVPPIVDYTSFINSVDLLDRKSWFNVYRMFNRHELYALPHDHNRWCSTHYSANNWRGTFKQSAIYSQNDRYKIVGKANFLALDGS